MGALERDMRGERVLLASYQLPSSSLSSPELLSGYE